MSNLPAKELSHKRVDTKEFDLPETIFVSGIENKVFQQIVLQCIAKIEGVSLAGNSFIENIFARSGGEGIKGIIAEQDSKNQSVGIKVELSIRYGVSIPKKAEEIQTKVSEEITQLTGLHVSFVHIIFKEIQSTEPAKKLNKKKGLVGPILASDQLEEEYTDDF